MKKVSIVFAFLFSLTAHGTIQDSSLDNIYQKQIYKAVESNCGLWRGELRQTSINIEEDIVDNGLIDLYLTAKFVYKVAFDQGQWDYYQVELEAVIYSQYDHTHSHWGVLRILSLDCR